MASKRNIRRLKLLIMMRSLRHLKVGLLREGHVFTIFLEIVCTSVNQLIHNIILFIRRTMQDDI